MITALKDDTGTLRGFAKVTRDLTERKRAEDALRESEARWQAFLDRSSSVIFVKDTTGHYTDVNRQFESVFGLAKDQILNRTDQEIFDPVQAAAFWANDLKVLAQGVPIQFEEMGKYCDGLHTSVVEKFPLRDAQGRVYAIGGIATDITARKKAEEALRETQETLQTIFDAAPVAILGVDRAGRITSWNKGAHSMFGWTTEEAVGRVCPTVPKDGLRDYHAMISRVLRHGPQTGMVRYRQKKSGDLIHAGLSAAPLRDAADGHSGVLIILEDISERMGAQQRLKDYAERLEALSGQLLQAQEGERRRIARELHDQVGQALTLIQVNLQAARDIPGSPGISAVLNENILLVESVVQQVRSLCLDLHSSLLEDLGLVPALRWHLDRLFKATGVQVQLRATASVAKARWPTEIETACFWVAQEALTNVLRHARAGNVKVHLFRTRSRLILRLTDDGIGFEVPTAAKQAIQNPKLGLLSMEERTKLVRGEFTITSAPGKGTSVCASFPLILGGSNKTP
ncbi:MAG: PAS domain S-box protein [Limisphaerales bacterium]